MYSPVPSFEYFIFIVKKLTLLKPRPGGAEEKFFLADLDLEELK